MGFFMCAQHWNALKVVSSQFCKQYSKLNFKSLELKGTELAKMFVPPNQIVEIFNIVKDLRPQTSDLDPASLK